MTLVAHNVTVTRSGNTLLDSVSVTLAPGERVALVGENGAGKTTLLDALAGLRAPTAGRVTLAGDTIGALSPRERARRIASLGQIDPPAPGLLVAARIGQGLAARRGAQALLDDAALARVHDVASELGVAALVSRQLGSLSGGERRRVEVARALIDNEARAYLLDEPHAGVDARHHQLVSDALARRAEAGRVVLCSMHDLTGALRYADRVIGLAGGALVLDARGDDAFTPDALSRVYGVPGEVLRGASGARGVVLDVATRDTRSE